MNYPNHNINNRKGLLKYLLYNNYKLAGATLLFSTISLLLQLPMPLLSKYIIDDVIVPKNLLLLRKAIMFFGIYLFGRIISVYLKNRFIIMFRTNTNRHLRALLYKHILYSKLTMLSKYQSGYLVERLHSDSAEISKFLGDSLPHLLENTLTFLSGAILCWYISHKLALITYVFLPFYALSTKLWGKRVYDKQYRFKDTRSTAFGITNTFLRHIIFLKTLSNFDVFIKKYEEINNSLFNAEKDVLNVTLLASLTIQIISFLSPVITLLYGAYEIINSRLTVGGLIAFNSYVSYLFNPIKNFVNLTLVYQRGKSSIDKIIEFLTLPPEENMRTDNIDTRPKDSSIILRNIKFYYNNGDIIFDGGFNLEIPAGSLVIVQGKSGIGKSTLFLLMMRLYDLKDGQIIIGGKDIRTLPLKTLRNFIGYIPQNPVLFPGTIYENLKISNPDATPDDIYNALDIACCNFLRKTKHGIFTTVKEMTENFSGGELVRINLAMAIIKKPKILLLDETLSQIDHYTRKCMVSNISSFAKKNGTKTIWITHGNFEDLASLHDFTKIFIRINGKGNILTKFLE